jgi:hypothetical protein
VGRLDELLGKGLGVSGGVVSEWWRELVKAASMAGAAAVECSRQRGGVLK